MGVLDFDAEVKWQKDICLPIRTLADTNQFSKPRIFDLIWSFGDLKELYGKGWQIETCMRQNLNEVSFR